MEEKKEVCYKGFLPGLICRGKQYAENTVFEEPTAEICNSGMHYCKNPFDVLDYYGFLNDDCEFNDFATAEPLAEEKTDDGKKFCTTKIKIGAKIDFPGFVKACVDFAVEKTKFDYENNSSGNSAQIGSSGDSARIGSSGYSARIGSSGDSARIGSSGYSAQIGSSGNYAKIGSSGNYAQIGSTGKHAVIMCAGNESKAKAKKGSFITLAEWIYSDEEDAYIPINVKTEKVDGERIKADTWYKLKNGEFVEC